jgi:hypothetical protein
VPHDGLLVWRKLGVAAGELERSGGEVGVAGLIRQVRGQASLVLNRAYDPDGPVGPPAGPLLLPARHCISGRGPGDPPVPPGPLLGDCGSSQVRQKLAHLGCGPVERSATHQCPGRLAGAFQFTRFGAMRYGC